MANQLYFVLLYFGGIISFHSESATEKIAITKIKNRNQIDCVFGYQEIMHKKIMPLRSTVNTVFNKIVLKKI